MQWSKKINGINRFLWIALASTMVWHGGLLFYTFKRTFDAYVHIFFADHYARSWFDHWEYRWYTGFTMTSYPPGSHQLIALLSYQVGLQNGFIIVQTGALLLFVIGVYRWSRLWVSDQAAGYAALACVFSSSIVETVHVFGQLPTTFSLSFLLNGLPFVYYWVRSGKKRMLWTAWAIIAATTAGHHVTTLFGSVFFVGPVLVLALYHQLNEPHPEEPLPTTATLWPRRQKIKQVRAWLVRAILRTYRGIGRSGIFGVGLISLLVLVVFPYWAWSKSDPITQVSIPHSSRDSYIANPNAGLAFWLIPYGLTIFIFPYLISKGLRSKTWPLGLSFLLLMLLGTGGTTPIPRFLLKGAYEILTLDRFTFWATICSLPLMGEFVVSLQQGRVGMMLQGIGRWVHQAALFAIPILYLGIAILVSSFTQFRRIQPEPISTQPITTFLAKDQHWRWRYMTLGFGDQFAWLSANTTANSVDGNYHSARRLPELTTTPVERLEGAKFSGLPGLGSLQQILAIPDKYNLKYIFSNDEFYDPLLYFSGWHAIGRLENGIMVWEKGDIPPLPELLPRKEIPTYQRAMWGILPLTALSAGTLAMLSGLAAWLFFEERKRWRIRPMPFLEPVFANLTARLLPLTPFVDETPHSALWTIKIPTKPPVLFLRIIALIFVLGLCTLSIWLVRQNRPSAESTLIAYYDDLDFRRFDEAYRYLDPTTRPNFELFMLQLSVKGGLLASYAKLDAVRVEEAERGANYVDVIAHTDWITSLKAYQTTQRHRLWQRNGEWVIENGGEDISIPPDQLIVQENLSWFAQQRRRVTTNTTAFADVLDRPELQILSAQLVRTGKEYHVVGELLNTDADPADLTVTALLYDTSGTLLSSYNAQKGLIHTILPKEVTPFRIDFEGVAGSNLGDDSSLQFDPNAFTSAELTTPIAKMAVYAKGVVTSHGLYRGLATQKVRIEGDQLKGELINNGVETATIPHVFLTYYDKKGKVAWIADFFIEEAVRPQRTIPFELPLANAAQFDWPSVDQESYTNILADDAVLPSEPTFTKIPLPTSTGFASLTLSVHTFIKEEE